MTRNLPHKKSLPDSPSTYAPLGQLVHLSVSSVSSMAHALQAAPAAAQLEQPPVELRYVPGAQVRQAGAVGSQVRQAAADGRSEGMRSGPVTMPTAEAAAEAAAGGPQHQCESR